MPANSAPRHLLLAASAVALLLVGNHFNGSIAHAQTASAQASADLDTLIMASMQNSGQADAASAIKKPDAKASAEKSAGKRVARKESAKKKKIKPAPVVVEVAPAPAQGGGGLLAAIGAIGGGSIVSPAPMAAKPERLVSASGPAVYNTLGYGQSLQAQPRQELSQQPSPFGIHSMSIASASQPDASKPDSSKSNSSKSNSSKKLASKSGKSSSKQIASVAPAAPAAAEPPAPASGLSGFFASLGLGGSAASAGPDSAKADVPAKPPESAAVERPANNAANDQPSHASDQVAGIGQPSGKSQSRMKHDVEHVGSIDKQTDSAPQQPAPPRVSQSGKPLAAAKDAEKSAVLKKPLGESGKASPRIVVAEAAPPADLQPPASNAGGLLAALGVGGGRVEPGPMEAKAQITVVYPEPAAVSRDATMVRREMAVAPRDSAYRIDSGDKLRVVVYGQDGLTNTYAIDAGGGITMPLIGRVPARGQTPGSLAASITERLRKGFIREPSVAVEIDAYRPFFILGEVAAPGQYPYVPNMSVEAAVAIAGGFSPRARRDSVTVTHPSEGGSLREVVPLGTPLSPGDTVMVGERWF